MGTKDEPTDAKTDRDAAIARSRKVVARIKECMTMMPGGEKFSISKPPVMSITPSETDETKKGSAGKETTSDVESLPGQPSKLVFKASSIDGQKTLIMKGSIDEEAQKRYGFLLPMDWDPKRVKKITALGTDGDKYIISDHTLQGRILIFKTDKVIKDFDNNLVLGSFQE